MTCQDVERSKAEMRMIRRFQKKGGRGFRVLRSAEVSMKHYLRFPPTQRGDA